RPSTLFAWARASSLLREYDFHALEQALAGFLALGDIEAAADVEDMWAIALWTRGQAAAADDHLSRAEALIKEAPLSASKVRVLADRARFLMFEGDHEASVRAAREVLSMAEELGLDADRAGLLNNIGTARVAAGDEAGLADLEQSLAIGLEHGFPDHLHRTYHNLMESYRKLGRLEKSAEILAEERRSDERFGLQRLLRWVIGEEATDRYLRAHWDEALNRAESMIAQVEAGNPHYQEPACRLVRAAMQYARGDDQGADGDSARALAFSRDQRDVQALAPALSARARFRVASACADEASKLVDEALALPLYYSGLVDLAWTLVELDRGRELLARRDEVDGTPWGVAALAIASGRFAEAADVLADMGAASDEAYARLRA